MLHHHGAFPDGEAGANAASGNTTWERGGAVPDSPRRRRALRGRSRGVILAVVVLVLLGVGAWLWLRSRSGSGPAAADGKAATAQASSAAAREGPSDSLPSPAASDSLVRAWMEGLSSHPRLAEWLATDDLVRRFVRAVVSVALGRSPHSELEFMGPDEAFRVRRAGDTVFVDPDSYHRYDGVAETFTALDTGAAARLYGRLRPLFQEAYRDLGYGEGSFDAEMARAVEELEAVPVPDGPVELLPKGGTRYAFADPRLERLDPAQKQLLRMGPGNVRRVQGKLEDLAEALGLPTLPSE